METVDSDRSSLSYDQTRPVLVISPFPVASMQ